MFDKKDIKDTTARTITIVSYVSKYPSMHVNSDPAHTLNAIRATALPLKLMSATSDTYMGFTVWAIPTPIP